MTTKNDLPDYPDLPIGQSPGALVTKKERLRFHYTMKTFIAALLLLLLMTQPALAAPVLRSSPKPLAKESEGGYLLRPYDTLKISVVNQPQLTTTQSITPDGQLSLPFIGFFDVKDLTLNQLEGKYKQALSPYVQKPQVVIELTPAPIYIIQKNLKDSTFDVKIVRSTTEAFAYAGGSLSQVTSDQLRVTVDHGQTLSVEVGEHPDWWEKNWYRVISAVAVVTGVYLSVRK